jgi:hypothetical protein
MKLRGVAEEVTMPFTVNAASAGFALSPISARKQQLKQQQQPKEKIGGRRRSIVINVSHSKISVDGCSIIGDSNTFSTTTAGDSNAAIGGGGGGGSGCTSNIGRCIYDMHGRRQDSTEGEKVR